MFYKKDTKSKRGTLNNLEVGPGTMEEKTSSADRSQQCGNALWKNFLKCVKKAHQYVLIPRYVKLSEKNMYKSQILHGNEFLICWYYNNLLAQVNLMYRLSERWGGMFLGIGSEILFYRSHYFKWVYNELEMVFLLYLVDHDTS